MIVEYVNEALRRARYEMISDPLPFYAEVRGLRGVWARGKTLEQCREHLAEVIEGWILVRLRDGLSVPRLGRYGVSPPKKLPVRG